MLRQKRGRRTERTPSDFNTPFYRGNDSDVIQNLVDTERCNLNFSLLHSVVSMKLAYNIISNHVFSEGIEITHGGEVVRTNKDFERFLSIYYVRFGKDAMKWIMTVGLVPITFVYLEEADEIVPVVLEPGSGTITSVYANHRQSFFWTNFGPQTEERDVIVLSGFDCSESLEDDIEILLGRTDIDADPRIDGKLTSVVNSVLPYESTASIWMDCATTSERITSNPAFVVQTRPGVTRAGNRLGMDYQWFAEFQENEEIDEQRIFRRDEASLRRLNNINRDIHEQFYTGSERRNMNAEGDLLPLRPWSDNEYHVPENMELVSQTLPKTRTDLISFLNHKDSLIYNVMGIPEFMATGSTKNRGADSDTLNDMFKTTISTWKAKIGIILTQAYNMIYGRRDSEFMLKSLMRRGRFDATRVTEDHIYKLQKDNEFSLNLPIRPFSSVPELKMIYESGGMQTLEFVNYMRKIYGLTTWDVLPKEGMYEIPGVQSTERSKEERSPRKKVKPTESTDKD